MADPSTQIDLAGMTLIVKDINVGANTSGQTGAPIPGGTADPTFDSVTTSSITTGSITTGSITIGDLVVKAGDMEAVAAGAQATHTHSLEIEIDGTTYWIMLSNTNANE
jgi:hypothetical protein